MNKFRFTEVAANIGVVQIQERTSILPTNIYEYSKAFREVYMLSMPILKEIANIEHASYSEILQLHGKAQSLAVQISVSNELLLKAILLGCTGKTVTGHSLKKLLNKLDPRLIDYIKMHLLDYGLKPDSWDDVIEKSDLTFITARYGFEGKSYTLDFITLQLLNEALDDIFNRYVPDWTLLSKEEQKSETILMSKFEVMIKK